MSNGYQPKRRWLGRLPTPKNPGPAGGVLPPSTHSLPEIIEAVIIRDPQPNDVVVMRVPWDISDEDMAEVIKVGRESLGCKVVALRGIVIESIQDERQP